MRFLLMWKIFFTLNIKITTYELKSYSRQSPGTKHGCKKQGCKRNIGYIKEI